MADHPASGPSEAELMLLPKDSIVSWVLYERARADDAEKRVAELEAQIDEHHAFMAAHPTDETGEG